MKKRSMCVFFLALSAVILGVLTGCGQNPPAAEPETDVVGELPDKSEETSGDDGAGGSQDVRLEDADAKCALQHFSYDLFAGSLEQENPVLSPASAYLALGLAGAGAEGETAREFESVQGSDAEVFCGDLMKILERSSEDLQVTIANSVWVDEELEPDSSWTDRVTRLCGAEMFHRQLSSAETMEELNGWISRETGGLIPRFLTQPLAENTRLALLNAIYFNGKWISPFETQATAERPFTNTSGEEVTVDMMHVYAQERLYLKNDIAEGVELPYRENYAFIALKPTGDRTVREMYEQLSMEEVAGMREEKDSRLMNLRLPKFEISFDMELNEVLADMGLNLAFDPERADFTGIGSNQSGNPLYIDLVRQKAVIRVDEEGTEAAAVTMVMTNEACALMEEQPIDVFFDEPFLYMIVESESGLPLFIGIVDDPSTGAKCGLPTVAQDRRQIFWIAYFSKRS